MLLLLFYLINFFFHENYFYFFMFRHVPECSMYPVLSTPEFIYIYKSLHRPQILPNYFTLLNKRSLLGSNFTKW